VLRQRTPSLLSLLLPPGARLGWDALLDDCSVCDRCVKQCVLLGVSLSIALAACLAEWCQRRAASAGCAAGHGASRCAAGHGAANERQVQGGGNRACKRSLVRCCCKCDVRARLHSSVGHSGRTGSDALVVSCQLNAAVASTNSGNLSAVTMPLSAAEASLDGPACCWLCAVAFIYGLRRRCDYLSSSVTAVRRAVGVRLTVCGVCESDGCQ
jgi:hypothetical protein